MPRLTRRAVSMSWAVAAHGNAMDYENVVRPVLHAYMAQVRRRFTAPSIAHPSSFDLVGLGNRRYGGIVARRCLRQFLLLIRPDWPRPAWSAHGRNVRAGAPTQAGLRQQSAVVTMYRAEEVITVDCADRLAMTVCQPIGSFQYRFPPLAAWGSNASG